MHARLRGWVYAVCVWKGATIGNLSAWYLSFALNFFATLFITEFIQERIVYASKINEQTES